ncbi:uncharacterized protein L203_106184 [Cryptococcus depauperatus CBS 7841]|uniref:DUF862-domain-containing protein n=1 Tax=Cryptococcus depauperatus CBS 7841 TaxID=1295531 RepID=A0AAJ8JZ24_9TREE
MAKVQLYVYDISQGLAKSMSLMLTGKQLDGIWHTSVIVFGREIYYGQGILESQPGATHHGPPLHIIDVGETHIDQDTFNEYIASLGEMYTPSKYHLIDFNCNHFTADVIGFLTSKEIPAWISSLPSEFLSTPFGQMMKPQIDAMFRGPPSERPIPDKAVPTNGAVPAPAAGSAGSASLASALLQSVASHAATQAGGSARSASEATPSKTSAALPNPETSPLTLVSSSSNFHSILSQHSAVVVNFTNTPSCPPCKVIKPVYESIAALYAPTYGARGARFVEVELGIGQGREIAGQYGVQATPTFMFFKDGKKVGDMKGAAKKELENRIEMFMEECYPTHPHRKVYLPAIESLPKKPITTVNKPNYDALLSKLEGFLSGKGKEGDVRILRNEFVPFLQDTKILSETESTAALQRWYSATQAIFQVLKSEETFPLIDLWRLAIIKPSTNSLLSLGLSVVSTLPEPITTIITSASNALSHNPTGTPKPFILTVLRFFTNLTSSSELSNLLLARDGNTTASEQLTGVLVESLLYPDIGVRSAAAGVAFNIGLWRQKSVADGSREETVEVEWEIDVVSGLVEAISREEDEDVAHRLFAALALTVYLSPGYETNLRPTLHVLEAKNKIETKTRIWKKKEVMKLGEEIAWKLC